MWNTNRSAEVDLFVVNLLSDVIHKQGIDKRLGPGCVGA